MKTVPPEIVAAAQRAQAKWNVPASVSIGQWVLESGWGTHMPDGSNNPFGIKALAGQPSVTALTREVIHGESVMVQAAFRRFDSIDDAFDAHAEMLATKPAYARARKFAADPEIFADDLEGIYATDPNYGTALTFLMRADRLEVYDLPQDTQPPAAAPRAALT